MQLPTSNFFAISPGLIKSFLFKTSKVGGLFVKLPSPSSNTSSIYTKSRNNNNKLEQEDCLSDQIHQIRSILSEAFYMHQQEQAHSLH